MSTESAVLFSIAESLDIRSSVVSGAGDGVIFKDLPDRNLSVSVRALCLATDVPVIYKWMTYQYAGPLLTKDVPPRELEESYSCMIDSDFAQPFMGLVNNVPVCQIDIYKTLQDAISLYYDARPGDYGLQLVVAPLAIQDNIAILIRTCVEYFFSFPEVGRIIADIDLKNEWTNTLFKMAGFRCTQKVRIPYKTANLYVCTRDNLRRQG
ncbi:MAG TPA: GNAT family N-acetyltransferase [Puia sp.]|nr:GNAT family N-acetyltransferase [Puia sp.]